MQILLILYNQTIILRNHYHQSYKNEHSEKDMEVMIKGVTF